MDLPTTVGAALALGRSALESQSETPGLDTQLLLCEVLGRSRAWVMAHPEAPLESSHALAFHEALSRYQAGEALPHVLGWWEFYGRRFSLGPGVLIPRPETELMVEAAMEFLSKRQGGLVAADVGTGSGCIAVTLAAEDPGLSVVATDRSIDALRIARDNAGQHGVMHQMYLIQADLLTPLAIPFDLICANLPYIPTEILAELRVSRQEPPSALDGGMDGLDIIRRLMVEIPSVLAVGGRAIIEIGAEQRVPVLSIARETLVDCQLEIRKDLAHRDRLLVIDRVEEL